MITHLVKESDGHSYWVHEADEDEFECVCDRIVSKDRGCWCEVCQTVYCSHCGTRDYKGTGWFVCLDCQDNPERIIDALLSII